MQISDLFKNMAGLKEMAQQVNENMKNIKATGEAAAGMVKVTVNGSHEIVSLEIDDEMMNVKEKNALIALIKGAHNVAVKRIQERLQENLLHMGQTLHNSNEIKK